MSRYILVVILALPLTGLAAEPKKKQVCRHVPVEQVIHNEGFETTQHERVRNKQLRKREAAGKDSKLTPRVRYVCKEVQ